jgi:hypothetical protein
MTPPGSQIHRAPVALTLRQLRSGDCRVNFRDGNEATTYCTDNLEDAANVAVEMVRERAL